MYVYMFGFDYSKMGINGTVVAESRSGAEREIKTIFPWIYDPGCDGQINYVRDAETTIPGMVSLTGTSLLHYSGGRMRY